MRNTLLILLFLFSINERGQAQRVQQNKSEPFYDMHIGMFTHYMFPQDNYQWGATQWADGSVVQSLDELADNFDAENFANTAASMGAQYVIFTTWHANMNALYPSEVIPKWIPGHTSKRDVIRDLIRELKKKEIKVILYIHPCDGHDFSKEDQERTGWNDGEPYTKWSNFIISVMNEIIDRYGKDLYGFYLDGGIQRVDGPLLRKTILDKMPKAVLIQNQGLKPEIVDYGAHERMKAPYPATNWLRCQTITEEWWAKEATVTLSPELAYRYTILQAAVKDRTGGGVSWSFGPHPGGRWELGVPSFCDRLGKLINKTGNSLFGTRPSKAYVTLEGTALIGLPYVATESLDGQTTYLHVFSPPKGSSIQLPIPADGRQFKSAKFTNGEGILLIQDESGVRLTVESPEVWDDIDIIIELN